jgi:carboxypeptidase family protein/Big-like domain-containing protein
MSDEIVGQWWSEGESGGFEVNPVTNVALVGTTPSIGSTAQFTATATLSNSTTQSVTSQATWQSSSQDVVSVSASGLVMAVGAGEADITATYQSVSGRAHLTLVRVVFTISGLVTDATSGGIVRSAAISGANQPATTDNNGKYSIGGVTAGAITVTASASGYVTSQKTTSVTTDTTVDFALARVSAPTPSPAPTPTPTPGPIAEPGLPTRTPVNTTFRSNAELGRCGGQSSAPRLS